MSYYKKIPVLDAAEQAEFDKYLEDTYARDLIMARMVALKVTSHIDSDYLAIVTSVFDKLATPRIYLLQAWIHRKQQEKATSDEAWKETKSDEKC